MTDILDAYAHVALPRFLSGDEMLRVMDAHHVEKSLICTSSTCPDVIELSRSIRAHPDRFLAAGLPVGREKPEILAGIEAQLDSGFIGLRIPDSALIEHPEIFELMGRRGAYPFLIGGAGFSKIADALLRFLEAYPACRIFAPHFAGGGDPALLRVDPKVSRLFDHPRFFIIFSRHGAFDQKVLKPWAEALIKKAGWNRILFGSEFPVALYRNESYDSTTDWADRSGMGPSLKDRLSFIAENARRVLFDRRPDPGPLDPRWQRMDLKDTAPVSLFPSAPLKFSETENRKHLEAFLARNPGGEGSYQAFVGGLE